MKDTPKDKYFTHCANTLITFDRIDILKLAGTLIEMTF